MRDDSPSPNLKLGFRKEKMTRFRLLDDESDTNEEHREGAPGAFLAGPLAGPAVIEQRQIHNGGRYRAVVENLDFMWRWRIFRDGEMCQEGCSLSETSSCEAVGHVLAFYEVRDSNSAPNNN